MNSLAYDFAKFDQSAVKVQPQRPKIKRVAKTKPQTNPFPFNAVIMILVLLSIVGAVIFSRIQLTEISEQINSQSKLLNSYKSDNTRLNMELGNKLSLNNVEQYAIDKLGLVKLNSSQIEYIKISESNRIEVKKENDSNIFVSISNWFDSFLEYLS
jgi:hypothetical protein